MLFKVTISLLLFLTTLANPLNRDTNSESAWGDPKSNEAHDKTEHTKDVDKVYKSHVESSDLYTRDGQRKSPMMEEMHHKLNMEPERLRARLRQELAELRESLSFFPTQTSSALANMRERLAPLTQQLQSSLSKNVQDLCGQLSLYLQGLELTEVPVETNSSLYREAFHWMSQALEHSGSKLTDIIGDFQTTASRMINQQIGAGGGVEAESGLWQELSVRLGQEVSSLRLEAESRAGTLKAELAALLVTAQPARAEMSASIERFCQGAVLQNQVFLARAERLLLGLEEEKEPRGALPSLSHSSQPSFSLQEDFSSKLSALIQDILHSVQ